eukprot:GHVS01060770.1.p1 GENE.GHVS01060770.1~~GHVS01060770.1.p1  ORF type:complete len:698 (+),score=33.05 GHVS01060770.1:60-2153(+)
MEQTNNSEGVEMATTYPKISLPEPVFPLLEFCDLTCRLPAPRSSLLSLRCPKKPPRSLPPILNGISGSVHAGQAVAIIGPSGSGKSAFLSTLTGTFEVSSTGTIKSGGQIITGNGVRRMASYLRDSAVFLPDFSVYEALRYEALLRLPQNLSYSQKMEQVEQVIHATGISTCRGTRMALRLGRKLSGGEVKRVAIANALLSSPRLFLLDEPTTGLDASRAAAIVELVCGLAEKRQLAVFCVAHQLSTPLLLKFNRLMIFSRGSLIYQGDTADARHYFEALGFKQPPNASLSEWLSTTAASETYADMLIGAYQSSVRCSASGCYDCYFSNKQACPVSLVDRSKSPAPRSAVGSGETTCAGEPPEVVLPKRRAASLWAIKVAQYGQKRATTAEKTGQVFWGALSNLVWWRQMYWLFRRRLLQASRRSITLRWVALSIAISVLAALVFFSLFRNLNESSFLHVRGFFFYTASFTSMSLVPSIISSYDDMPFYRLEASAKTYRISALLIARSIADLVIDQIAPSAFFVLVYFFAGLPPIASVFWPSWVVILIFCWTWRSLTNLVSQITQSHESFQILFIIVFCYTWIFGGIIVPVSDIPPWLSWTTWLSVVTYTCDALVALILTGHVFACGPNSFQPVCPVPGEVYGATLSSHELSTSQNICALLGFGTLLNLLTYAVYRRSPTCLKMRNCRPSRSGVRHA